MLPDTPPGKGEGIPLLPSYLSILLAPFKGLLQALDRGESRLRVVQESQSRGRLWIQGHPPPKSEKITTTAKERAFFPPTPEAGFGSQLT